MGGDSEDIDTDTPLLREGFALPVALPPALVGGEEVDTTLLPDTER